MNIDINKQDVQRAEDAFRRILSHCEDDAVTSIAVHCADTDSNKGSLTVAMRRGKDCASGHAVSLWDAMHIATGKLDEIERKRADEKADTAKEGQNNG